MLILMHYIYIILFILLLWLLEKLINFQKEHYQNIGPTIQNEKWQNNNNNYNCQYKSSKNNTHLHDKSSLNSFNYNKNINLEGACLTTRNNIPVWGIKSLKHGDLCYVKQFDSREIIPKTPKNDKNTHFLSGLVGNDYPLRTKKDIFSSECINKSEIYKQHKELIKKYPYCKSSYHIEKCGNNKYKIICDPDNKYYYGLKSDRNAKNITCVPLNSDFNFECQKVNKSNAYGNKELTKKGCKKGYIQGTCSTIYKNQLKFANKVSNCLNWDTSLDRSTEMNEFIIDKCNLDLSDECNQEKVENCWEKKISNCLPNKGRIYCYED